jgi:putative chitinase
MCYFCKNINIMIINLYNKYKTMLNEHGINTPLRLAHFFAQIEHESGGFKILKESLNYSLSGLLSTFGRHRISVEQAKRFSRTATRRANQIAIANTVYGGEWGLKNLGNTQPNDGSKFIGRGFKQVTGRANYTQLSKDTGIDYVNNPELLLREADAMLSACWFWKKNNCNRFADADDIEGLTRVINGGKNGLEQRRELTVKNKKIFK